MCGCACVGVYKRNIKIEGNALVPVRGECVCVCEREREEEKEKEYCECKKKIEVHVVECIRVRYGVCECVRACVEEREREMRPDSVSIVNLKRDDSFNRDSIFIFLLEIVKTEKSRVRMNFSSVVHFQIWLLSWRWQERVRIPYGPLYVLNRKSYPSGPASNISRSVMIAVIRLKGVTSKDGFMTLTPSAAILIPFRQRTSSWLRSSIFIFDQIR